MPAPRMFLAANARTPPSLTSHLYGGHQDAIGDISVCRNEPAKRDSRRTSVLRTTSGLEMVGIAREEGSHWQANLSPQSMIWKPLCMDALSKDEGLLWCHFNRQMPPPTSHCE